MALTEKQARAQIVLARAEGMQAAEAGAERKNPYMAATLSAHEAELVIAWYMGYDFGVEPEASIVKIHARVGGDLDDSVRYLYLVSAPSAQSALEHVRGRYPAEHCTHAYDCCGRFYLAEAQLLRRKPKAPNLFIVRQYSQQNI